MKRIPDNILIPLHLSFIIFTYFVALVPPFYFMIILTFAHAAHEAYLGECYLTILQKRWGYSGKDDDFFYHILNNRLGFSFSRKFTMNIHWFVKITVLLIVMTRAGIFAYKHFIAL